MKKLLQIVLLAVLTLAISVSAALLVDRAVMQALEQEEAREDALTAIRQDLPRPTAG